MALRTARDRRLTGQDSLTNVLSGTATTGTGGVTEEETTPGITGTPKEGAGAGPVTTTQSQQQNQQQAQQQSQQQSNVATKMPKQPARSGMFTNVKKILEKNKPAVQQMGQQAGQQFATTAEKVKQQAQQQFQNVQGQIQQAQKDVQSQEEAGKKAIESVVTSPLPEETAPVEETEETPATAEELLPEAKGPTLADFGSTAEQIAQGTSQLDLGKKIQEARELQAQAQGIMTDASKRNLLRDVFGRGQRQYTSGAQSLDNLLLAMSPQAGKQLTETVQQSARGLGDISRLQSEGEGQYQRLLEAASGVGGRLGEASQSSLDQLFGNIESGTEDYIEQRADTLTNLTNAIQNSLDRRRKNIQERASEYALNDLFDKTASADATSYNLKDKADNFFSSNRLDLLGYDFNTFKSIIDKYPNLLEYNDTSGGYLYNDDPGHEDSIFVSGKERRKANARVAAFKKELQNFLDNPNLETQQVEGVEGLELDPTTIGFLSDYFKDKGYYDPETGISGLFTGSDLQEGSYYGYSDKDIARINAIKKLRGETDFITPSENYLTIDDLQNLISGGENYEEENLLKAISSYFRQN
jgi:hypothetical protein